MYSSMSNVYVYMYCVYDSTICFVCTACSDSSECNRICLYKCLSQFSKEYSILLHEELNISEILHEKHSAPFYIKILQGFCVLHHFTSTDLFSDLSAYV